MSSYSEHISALRLARSENIGPRTFISLLEYYGSPGQALEALPQILSKFPGSRNNRRKVKICPLADAELEFELLKKAGGHLITILDDEYPKQLQEIENPPPVLSLFGSLFLLKHNMISIVGSRNASGNARIFTRNLAHELGQNGIKIVSGFARGIDTAAHEGSLNSGTIAVLAGGVDNIYPAENKKLYQQIKEEGAIISENPLGCAPSPSLFPRRNRIISGLALGIVIVEARAKSGSLITAHLASEQGRDVFAVPGSPQDPRCSGSNNLIKQGAILTEDAQDILGPLASELNIELDEDKPPKFINAKQTKKISLDEKTMKKLGKKIVEFLSATPIGINDIMHHCQMNHQEISYLLLNLEVNGKIERHPGNKIALIME